jgi:hypothetical protein
MEEVAGKVVEVPLACFCRASRGAIDERMSRSDK